jgi:Cys-tRNA(Pro)/Cys-tRNA(Cys) deacylase
VSADRVFKTLIASAMAFGTVFCSGGRRGLEIELAPGDLVRAANATVARISSHGISSLR